jgi:CHAT domain-containing protein
MKRKKRFSSLIVLLIGLVAFLLLQSRSYSFVRYQSADEVALRALMENYLTAYGKEDFEALVKLWSARSQDLARSFETLQVIFQTEDYRFSDNTVSNIKISNNRAVLQVAAKAAITKTSSNEFREERFLRNFALVKEGGDWKIWRDASASEDLSDFLKEGGDWKVSSSRPLEEQFAGALLTARTNEDRQSLLNENKQLITVKLCEALLKEAEALQRRGAFSRALEIYRFTQTLAERLDDKSVIAFCLQGQGEAFRSLGSLAQALQNFQKALILFDSLGDGSQTAKSFAALGGIYLQSGKYQLAVEQYQKALAAYERSKNVSGVANMLEEIASVYYTQEKYPLAIENFLKCLKLREGLGNKAEIAATLNNIGNAYYYQENYDTAIDYYQKAIVGFREVKENIAIAGALNNIGSSYYSQGVYDAAIENYQNAFKLEEQINHKRGAANSLLGVGLVHYARGDFAVAIEVFEKNLVLCDALHEKADMANTLHNIGLSRFHQQSYELAAAAYQRSLKLYEELGRKEDVAAAIFDVAGVLYIQSLYDAALEQYQKALSAYEALQQAVGTAASLGGIAATYYAQQRNDLALEFYQKSLAQYEIAGEKERVASTLERIASVQNARGDYAQGLNFAERAANNAKEVEASETFWLARFTAGASLRAMNQPEEARKKYEEAIAAIEAMRGELIDGEKSQRFFKDKTAPYLAMMELLISQSKTVEAYAYAEIIKAHFLWDVLHSGGARITKTLTAQEDQTERDWNKSLLTLKRQLDKEKKRRNKNDLTLLELKTRTEKTRQAYEAFQKKLYAIHPQLKALRGEVPAGKAEEIARLLDAKTALLEFVVTDSRAYLFVSTKDTNQDAANRKRALPETWKASRNFSRSTISNSSTANLTVYVLNVSRKELADRVAGFRGLIEQKSEQVHQAASELYDLIVKPANLQLHGKSSLVIIPDSVLWNLPFAALQSAQSHYLIEDFDFCYAQSLTAWREMRKPRMENTNRRLADDRVPKHRMSMPQLLVVANPAVANETLSRARLLKKDETALALPKSEGEAQALRQLYGEPQSLTLFDLEANEARFKAEAEKYSVVHLAANLGLTDASPMYSYALLSKGEAGGQEDGLLQAWELMKLNLRARAIVLSACEFSQNSNGDGLTGLSWGLFVAGCPSTVISQWRAYADAPEFIVEFHRHLKAQVAPVQALRQSALKMLKGQNAHPFYWARFLIVGDGK